MLTKTFALSDDQYLRFRQLLLERSGIYFPEEKRDSLARGLSGALKQSTIRDLNQYYQLLVQSKTNHPEWDRLISILTVGETYFFRNNGHFNALRNEILPEIITRRERLNRRIRLWSAGCATGEEPYSLAILLREMVPNLSSWQVTLLATDINREAIVRAKEGVYSPWSFRGVDQALLTKYFHNEGKQYRIKDEIKRMVQFEYLNLIEDHFPSLTNNTSGMDLILCRNVTIYFSQNTTRDVVGKFFNCLVDGGWYIPGSSEPNLINYRAFTYRNFPGAVLYQRPGQTSANGAVFSFGLPQTATPPPAKTAILPNLDKTRPLQSPPPPRAVVGEKPPVIPLLSPLDEAKKLLQNGQVDRAIDKLFAHMDRGTDDAEVCALLCKIYANRGQFEEAQNWCERAIQVDKLQPQPYFTLSMIYQGKGLPDNAIDALKKCLFLDPVFILAHYALANLYLQRGDQKLAGRHLQNVNRLLAGREEEELIPEGDGLVVGRLMELVDSLLAKLA